MDVTEVRAIFCNAKSYPSTIIRRDPFKLIRPGARKSIELIVCVEIDAGNSNESDALTKSSRNLGFGKRQTNKHLND